MQRRNFIKTAALSAIAISATGFVRFNGERYEGDCATTSDVLGLFYRPDSPLRKNLIIKGRKGNPVELLGRVLHKDCTTPYKNTKIERWHCNGEGVYDNETTDFKYQGTTGLVTFKTFAIAAELRGKAVLHLRYLRATKNRPVETPELVAT